MPIIGSRGAASAGGFGQRQGQKTVEVQYVVVAGGGAGGSHAGGGGGAGGYRTNVPGQASGGPAGGTAEATYEAVVGKALTITVGGGGSGVSPAIYPTPTKPTDGSDSVFDEITSLGGGYGNNSASPSLPAPAKTPVASDGQPGGSGGAGYFGSPAAVPTGNPTQGYPGGQPSATGPGFGGGAGGGATGAGNTGQSGGPGAGGAGQTTNITGSPVTLAGGGGGGLRINGGSPSTGGPGGGGRGGKGGSDLGAAGTVNTGGGGGGGGYQPAYASGSSGGGSGVVYLSVPTDFTATFSPGITQTPSTTPTARIYTVTAGTGTVTFS